MKKQQRNGQKIPLETQKQIISLYLEDVSPVEIADQCNVHYLTVRKYINKYVDEMKDDTMALAERGVIAKQLKDITRCFMAAALAGDNKAAKTILETIDRRAKIFGLYQPEQVVNVHTTVSNDSNIYAGYSDEELEYFVKQTSAHLDQYSTIGQSLPDID